MNRVNAAAGGDSSKQLYANSVTDVCLSYFTLGESDDTRKLGKNEYQQQLNQGTGSCVEELPISHSPQCWPSSKTRNQKHYPSDALYNQLVLRHCNRIHLAGSTQPLFSLGTPSFRPDDSAMTNNQYHPTTNNIAKLSFFSQNLRCTCQVHQIKLYGHQLSRR